MAIILRRYWSDIVVLGVCLTFGLLLLAQGGSGQGWDSGAKVLVVARN